MFQLYKELCFIIIPPESLKMQARCTEVPLFSTARFIFDFYFLSAVICFRFIGKLRGVNVEDRERNLPQFLAVCHPKSVSDFPGNDSLDVQCLLL